MLDSCELMQFVGWQRWFRLLIFSSNKKSFKEERKRKKKKKRMWLNIISYLLINYRNLIIKIIQEIKVNIYNNFNFPKL